MPGTIILTKRQETLLALLAVLNGLLAVVAMDALYTLSSSPGIWLIPAPIAVPYAAFTIWRAHSLLRSYLRSSTEIFGRAVAEGAALLGISAATYTFYLPLRLGSSHWGDVEWGTVVYAAFLYGVILATIGAFIAALLAALDLVCIDLIRLRRRAHS